MLLPSSEHFGCSLMYLLHEPVVLGYANHIDRVACSSKMDQRDGLVPFTASETLAMNMGAQDACAIYRLRTVGRVIGIFTTCLDLRASLLHFCSTSSLLESQDAP